MAEERSIVKKANLCLAQAKANAERMRTMYGPPNSELLREIQELKAMVTDLKILVLTKQH